MKSSGTRLLFWGEDLITVSLYLLMISLFIFSDSVLECSVFLFWGDVYFKELLIIQFISILMFHVSVITCLLLIFLSFHSLSLAKDLYFSFISPKNQLLVSLILCYVFGLSLIFTHLLLLYLSTEFWFHHYLTTRILNGAQVLG